MGDIAVTVGFDFLIAGVERHLPLANRVDESQVAANEMLPSFLTVVVSQEGADHHAMRGGEGLGPGFFNVW